VSESRLRAVLAALALLGAGIAAYLTYVRYTGAPIACPTGGCETVQRSRYADVAGVPVAVLGLAAYAALLGSALASAPAAAALGAAVALAGLAFSAWLLYAQLVLIGAVCQWCLANDAVIALAAAASLARLRTRQPSAGEPSRSRP
jgi:uncharacterized membrane protein